jgi:hypothetical protein
MLYLIPSLFRILIPLAGCFVQLQAAAETFPVYVYLQGFPNDTGSFQKADSYGWRSFYGESATEATAVSSRVHYYIGSVGVENVNASTPYGDGIEQGTWTANTTSIQHAFTDFELDAGQAQAAQLTMDINSSQKPTPMAFTIEVEGQWYAAEQPFIHTAAGWLTCTLSLGEDTLWAPLSFEPGVRLQRESGPAHLFSDIAGPVSAVGVYIEPDGTHRFDNFGVILPSDLADGGVPVPLPPVSREEMIDSMLRYFGGPDPATAPAPEVNILGTEEFEDHQRIHMRYLVGRYELNPGEFELEYSYAYLLLPKPLPREGEKLPLIMCPHPTYDWGKDRAVGIYDEPPTNEAEREHRAARGYALEYVRRGFITFAPDRAGYGERRLLPEGNYLVQMNAYRDYLAMVHPGWKLTSGKNVWDLQRALDFIVDLPYVDADNIGIVGFSLGAWDSIMTVGMDDRIKAAAVNSGGMVDYKKELWEDPDVLEMYLESSSQNMSANVNIWMMLTAPRSLMYLWSLQDAYESGGPHILEGHRVMTGYWEEAGRTQPAFNKADLNIHFHGNGHDFPPEARDLVYRWFVDRLGDPLAR